METSRRGRNLSSSSSGPKVQRKVVEKDRRELQKGLYAQLHSLLPPTPHALSHMEEVVTMPLPDQIEEAVKYIKTLKTKVEQMKEKKEKLLRTSSTLPSSHLSSSSSFDFAYNIGIPDQATTSSAQTKIMVEIQDMGPLMDVIVVTGLGRVDMFYDIIHLLHQEHGVDVGNASFSFNGNSVIQIIHKMGKEISGFEAGTLTRKLESLIYGSSSSSGCDNNLLEMKQLQFWEFDEQLDTILWGFQPFPFDDNSLQLE